MPLGSSHLLPEVSVILSSPRLGTDLSQVRVHDGVDAARAADEIGARAFTIGDAVVFNRDEYDPHSNDGRQLLAHELSHVVQQGRTSTPARENINADGAPVREAAPAATVQRQPIDISPADPADAYLTDEAELNARLAQMSAGERAQFIDPLLLEVQQNWQRAAACGLIEMLEEIPAAEGQMPANPVQPIAGVENATMKDLGYDLRFDESTQLGRQLVLGEVSLEVVSQRAMTRRTQSPNCAN